ncbi:MAG: trigger factor, partial [Gammaproteobacteria bacterium]|nr:trigger factor [Gammaproteobacteria bacterium]
AQMPAPEPFVEAARKRVALGLLVGRIVDEQGIEADRAAVEKRLGELAGHFGEPEQIVRAYRQDARLMGQIEMAVVEDLVVDWLIDKAKIKDRKMSFQDVIGQDS